MIKAVSLSALSGLSDCLGEKVIKSITELRTENFKSFADYTLMTFDCCDIRKSSVRNPKVTVYLGKENLFFICETEALVRTESILNSVLDDGIADCRQTLTAFFEYMLESDTVYLDSLEREIDNRETEFLENPSDSGKVLKKISHYRRKLLRIKRYYEQLNSIFDETAENRNGLLSETLCRRFEILSLRTDKYINSVIYLKEAVSQTLEAYQSQLSIRQNELMKIFTIVTAIFLPLSLIAGWYGMNFRGMPELSWEYGYPAVILISAAIALWLIWYFKKKKWL